MGKGGTPDTLEAYLAEQMRNPRFRKAWEQVREENKLTRELIRLRIEQGLTQAQVAEMLGTRQEAISRLEHNPPRRPTELLRKVASLYGCDVEAQIRLVPRSTRRTPAAPRTRPTARQIPPPAAPAVGCVGWQEFSAPEGNLRQPHVKGALK